MEINPHEVIKQLTSEISRLALDNAILRAALEAKEKPEEDGD
jgi:hypothetical protein